MRKSIVILLILSLTGCTTAAQTQRVATLPTPPTDTDSRQQIVGIVRADGSEVRFEGPASAAPDGSVTGQLPTEYAGATKGATATRAVRFEASEIRGYVLETPGQVDVGKSMGVVALSVVGFVGAMYLIWRASCDPHTEWFCPQ